VNLLAEEVSNIKVCANPECETLFLPTRHNQKYCGKECCKLVTNAKIMKQYYEKKERKQGKVRICQECGLTRLSRYNENNICQSCIKEEEKEDRSSLLQLIGAR
jgi:predicted RNA-binding Zn ribbon-like protein